jgi:hypothetical protein
MNGLGADVVTHTDLPRRHVLTSYPRPIQQWLKVSITQYRQAHVMVEAVHHHHLMRRPAELILARLAEFLLEAALEPAWSQQWIASRFLVVEGLVSGLRVDWTRMSARRRVGRNTH